MNTDQKKAAEALGRFLKELKELEADADEWHRKQLQQVEKIARKLHRLMARPDLN